MYAIIQTGGKQQHVSVGDVVRVEKLAAKTGDVLEFDVLSVVDGKNTKVGTPIVSGVKVSAKVLGEGKSKKIVVFKYKPKIGYRKKQGHRQPYTELEIVSIGDVTTKPKAAAKPAAKKTTTAAKPAAKATTAAKPAAKATTAAKPAAKKTTTAAKPAAKKTTAAAKPAAKKTTTAAKPAAKKTTTAKKPEEK